RGRRAHRVCGPDRGRDLQRGGVGHADRRGVAAAEGARPGMGVAGRRDFLSRLAVLAVAGTPRLTPGLRPGSVPPLTLGSTDRQYWLDVLTRLAHPVLTNLAEGRLRQRMPVEIAPAGNPERRDYTHLEAVGRLLTGIAPWLELGGDASPEGDRKSTRLNSSHQIISYAVFC